jgi:hypothetical protein
MKRAVALYRGVVKKDTTNEDATATNADNRMIHHPFCNIRR